MDRHKSCHVTCVGRRLFLAESMRHVVDGGASAIAALAMLTPMHSLHAASIGHPQTVQYPMPTADGISIDGANDVILCRSQRRIFAFALACPHQNTALRALSGAKGFQCPRHKSKYLIDGTFVNGKATRNMDRFPISRTGNTVVVELTMTFASDTQPGEWANAVVVVPP